jgi:hypothetical protein
LLFSFYRNTLFKLEKQAARRGARNTATGLAQIMRIVMAQVDSENTISMPARAASEIPSGLAIQQRERETALHALRRLGKEASAEIERLLSLRHD